MAIQKTYEARFVPAVGGSAIKVTIPANDQAQARKLIEQQYGPIKNWHQLPQQTK